MNLVAVIPALNEEPVISKVVSEVIGQGFFAVVVDDGSSDQTGFKAAEAGAAVLFHPVNCGQGAALQTGISYALANGADVIVTFDADGQFAASELQKIIMPLKNNEADVALGTRFLESTSNVPQLRRLVIQTAAIVTKFYTGLKISDVHNGFRAFNRQAAKKINITQAGMAHASEILEQIRKHRLRYVEVPTTVLYTDYSLSRGQKTSNAFKIVWDLILGRIAK